MKLKVFDRGGNRMEFGFVRETEQEAVEAGKDITGIVRTGLDTYLKCIFPDVNDWIHDRAFPGMRIRPDYRSDFLKIVVEFDGLPHFQSKEIYEKDMEKMQRYETVGYKVVRVPLYINLTTNAINNLFGTDLKQPFFNENVSPFNTSFQPNCFCITGLKRMANDYLIYAPDQISVMLESIQEKSPDEYAFLKQQGL